MESILAALLGALGALFAAWLAKRSGRAATRALLWSTTILLAVAAMCAAARYFVTRPESPRGDGKVTVAIGDVKVPPDDSELAEYAQRLQQELQSQLLAEHTGDRVEAVLGTPGNTPDLTLQAHLDRAHESVFVRAQLLGRDGRILSSSPEFKMTLGPHGPAEIASALLRAMDVLSRALGIPRAQAEPLSAVDPSGKRFWASVHYYLGVRAFVRSDPDYDSAVEYFSAAERADPTFAAATWSRAAVLEHQGQCEEALRAYHEAASKPSVLWNFPQIDEVGKHLEQRRPRCQCLLDTLLGELRKVDWTGAGTGLDYKYLVLQADICGRSYGAPWKCPELGEAADGLRILLIRAAIVRFDLHVVEAPDCLTSDQKAALDSVHARAEPVWINDRAVVVSSGGYVDVTGARRQHSGLVVSDGRMVETHHEKAGTGVILVREGRIAIDACQGERAIDVCTSQIPKTVTQALQAGPRLIEPWDGSFGIVNNNYDRVARVAVGLDRDSIFFVAVRGRLNFGLSLFELARLLYEDTSKGGLGCTSALHLCGASFAQLGLRGGSGSIAIPSMERPCSTLELRPRAGP
jgi:tetratricopeptide (TPR) repeat protein